jgi:hypothetical protein
VEGSETDTRIKFKFLLSEEPRGRTRGIMVCAVEGKWGGKSRVEGCNRSLSPVQIPGKERKS